jgi:alpha-D-xyloside xylohydrolase
MLGDSLLVAPVFHAEGLVRYYVPAGVWTHLLTGETVSGPAWREETHDAHSLPLLVRPGTALPWGAVEERPDYAYADGVRLRVFRPVDGVDIETIVPSATGAPAATFVTRSDGSVVTITRTSGTGPWCAQIGVGEPIRVDADTVALPFP